MTKKEAEAEGWDIDLRFKTAPVLVLDDGSKIYPSADEEGNGPGALFGVDKKGNHFIVIPSMKGKLKKVV
jgi:hypothetical protein